VNQDLRAIHEPGVVILDADDALVENGELRRSYSLDTLHLTPAGYAQLNLSLEKCLKLTAEPVKN
jgi:lysophospholipase L1-like esterase